MGVFRDGRHNSLLIMYWGCNRETARYGFGEAQYLVISVFQQKNDINSATKNPVQPTMVSITVHVLKVVFSSSCSREVTSQKPESLT